MAANAMPFQRDFLNRAADLRRCVGDILRTHHCAIIEAMASANARDVHCCAKRVCVLRLTETLPSGRDVNDVGRGAKALGD